MPQEEKKKTFCYKLMLDLSVNDWTLILSYTVGKISGFLFFPTSLPNTGGNALCVFHKSALRMHFY